ncbi:prophage Lp2 protein 52 [Lactiplantibacillus plantarum]|nr:prophage Lp2 protein 52 [Lactiplantibacillus plantarum]
MNNDDQTLTTNELATLPLDHNWYQKLASNFEIIQPYLNKLDTDELEVDDLKNKIEIIQPYLNKLDADELEVDDLKNKIDDISDKMNIYETNIEAIVNILSNYDVPIQIVDGKVVDTKEGE